MSKLNTVLMAVVTVPLYEVPNATVGAWELTGTIRCGNCQFPCKVAGQFDEEGTLPDEDVVVARVVETGFGDAEGSAAKLVDAVGLVVVLEGDVGEDVSAISPVEEHDRS